MGGIKIPQVFELHLIQSIKINDIFHQVLNKIKHLMKNITNF
jgi:hypothetical protein